MNLANSTPQVTKNFAIKRKDFSILVAQSEVFTCEVLCQLLKEQGYNVVGRANHLEATLQQIRVKRPQCAILDASLSDRESFEIVRQAKAEAHPTRFILYASQTDLRFMEQAMQVGFMGYLHASDGLDELYQCFQTVNQNAPYYSAGFTALLKNYGIDVLEDSTRTQLSRLSDRERQVLQLIAQGVSGTEVADQLNISYRTLVNHKTNMVKKLNLDGCKQLVRYGISVKSYL